MLRAVRTRRLFLLGVLATLLGCATDPTELVVLVDAEPAVSARATSVRLEAHDADGSPSYGEREISLGGALGFPVRFALRAADGHESALVALEVTALDGAGAAFVRRRLLARYRPEQLGLVRVTLEAACVERCAETEDCVDGRCSSPREEDSTPVDPGDIPPAGRPRDAGPDSNRPDANEPPPDADATVPDLGPDATSDAGPDARIPDSGPLDADVTDLGPADLGPGDLGPGDLGLVDLGPRDLGPSDLGPADLGPTDLGPADLGPGDVGPPDLGPLDTGPTCVPGGGCPTGMLGPCASGTISCASGMAACVPDVTPATETCNGRDDDCNGTPDDVAPVACSTGMPGVCAAGTRRCAAGADSCAPDRAPSAELCNGLDDDCNGFPDDAAECARFTSITGGERHTCALERAGRVFCWGSVGQRGDPGSSSRAPVHAVGTSDIVQLDAGGAHTCGLRPSGAVVCWGSNAYQECLADTMGALVGAPRESTITTTLGAAAHVSAGMNGDTCLVLSGGRIECFGNLAWPAEVVASGGLEALAIGAASGDCARTELSPGGTQRLGCRPELTPPLTDPIRDATVGGMVCVVLASGLVRCLAGADYAGCGSCAVPTVSGVTGARSVAAGSYHGCAVDAGGVVRCWGDARHGQVGDGTSGTTPLREPAIVALPAPAFAVGAGFDHSCALLTTGAVYCWGANDDGQVDGVPSGSPAVTPRLVTIPP